MAPRTHRRLFCILATAMPVRPCVESHCTGFFQGCRSRGFFSRLSKDRRPSRPVAGLLEVLRAKTAHLKIRPETDPQAPCAPAPPTATAVPPGIPRPLGAPRRKKRSFHVRRAVLCAFAVNAFLKFLCVPLRPQRWISKRRGRGGPPGFSKIKRPVAARVSGPSTLYHNRMVRVIVFSRLLGRKRRAGDAGHRQAALTPAKRREKRPFGRPWAAIGRRRAALMMGPHHIEPRS